MVATVQAVGGVVTQPIDAYVVVQTGGGLLSLQLDGRLVPGLVPIARNIVLPTVAAPFAFPLAGAPPGTYTVVGRCDHARYARAGRADRQHAVHHHAVRRAAVPSRTPRRACPVSCRRRRWCWRRRQSATVSGQTSAYGLTIPAAHPRLWWNAERMARAQAWQASARPSRRSSGDPLGQAYRCVVTGEPGYCQAAVTYAMNQLCRQRRVQFARPERRRRRRRRAVGGRERHPGVRLVLRLVHAGPAGHAHQPLEHLLPQHPPAHLGRPHPAPEQLQLGLHAERDPVGHRHLGRERRRPTSTCSTGSSTRWQHNGVGHFLGGGRGGVMQEGSAYGSALGEYAVVPFGVGRAARPRRLSRDQLLPRSGALHGARDAAGADLQPQQRRLVPRDVPVRRRRAVLRRRHAGAHQLRHASCRRWPTTGATCRSAPTPASGSPTCDPVRAPHLAAVDRGGAPASLRDAPARLLRVGAALAVRAQPVGAAGHLRCSCCSSA